MTIAIIGNGIIGMMSAYALSKRAPRQKIKLVGRLDRPGSASLAAAAMFNSFCEVESGSLLNPIERERFLFNKSATTAWPALLEEIRRKSGQPLHFGFGTFVLNNTATDSLEDDNFNAICAALREFNEPHSEIAPRDIKNYRPSATSRATRAVFINNEGWVNPRQFIDALQTIFQQNPNIELVNQNCHTLEASGGKVRSLKLEDGTTLDADLMLICNGAHFSKLMDASALGLPIQRIFYGVGATVLLECGADATENCIRTPNRGLACGIYSAPQTNTEIVIGASNFICPQPEAEVRVTSIYTLLKAAMEQINENYYRSRLMRVNVGWRPTSSDTLPLIGPTSLSNLFVATGTKRDGFHCSPVIAQYIADVMLDGKSQMNMNLYRPERPLTRLYTREEAIHKYVRHTINSLYQHDFVPSKNRLRDDLEQHYRREFEQLHDQVGAIDWGIPIEMKDMYRYGHIQ